MPAGEKAPLTKLQPVPWLKVKVADSFWSPRIETNRSVTLPLEYRINRKEGTLDAYKWDWWDVSQGKPPWRIWVGDLGKMHDILEFTPAYSAADVEELTKYCDHVVFNSFAQWRRFGAMLAAQPRPIECGLRVNPEYSEVKVPLYDPCAPNSRLGIRREDFEGQDPSGIAGLHFHCLCEQGADTLERTLAVVEEKFGEFLPGLKWVNFGGGHHITRGDYDVHRLCDLIRRFQQRHGLAVYLEPGEAVALNAGVLVASVLDIVRSGMDIAILDTSASAHMPDVLEMPYRPAVVGAGEPGEFPHTYRLGGLTCLAGDVIGDYSFPRPLAVGDRIVFLDMAHYTMVKATTFNGVRLPSIAICRPSGELEIVRRFGYEAYRDRLS